MKLYVYDDSHLKNHSPLKSNYVQNGYDPFPFEKNSKEKEVSKAANAFSST